MVYLKKLRTVFRPDSVAPSQVSSADELFHPQLLPSVIGGDHTSTNTGPFTPRVAPAGVGLSW